jgi:hypothetical protein
MQCRALSLALAVAVLGCGTPSRRLTTRLVDDPMVLPRRTLEMALAGDVGQRPRPRFEWNVLPTVTYGLTDRLELDDLLSLRWAVLDDAPLPVGDQRQRNRLSLAVRGGLRGIGYGDLSGWMLTPLATVELAKHLGTNTRVALAARWEGAWTEQQPALWSEPTYHSDLWPGGQRTSGVWLDADAVRQLGDHVALNVGVGVHQLEACTFPICTWASRGGAVWLGPSVRPRHWLSLALHVFAGARYRPAGVPVSAPDDRVARLPATASWIGTSAYVAFRW